MIRGLESISGSTLLDRLIRGRLWIGLLAFALIGIVAMQLLVLELNTGIGRTLTRVAELQRQNAQLGIEDSTYSAESRIAPLAAADGMTLVPVGAVHFVATSPADVSRAAVALSTTIQAPVSGTSETAGGEAGASSTTAVAAPGTAAAGETAGGGAATSSTSATTAGATTAGEAGGSAEGPGTTSGSQE